jgi:hypothetical protein
MNAQRARRLFAVSAVGVLMAGGATIGAAGTASAASQGSHSTQISRDWCDHHGWWNDHCDFRGGFNNGAVVVIVVG